MRPARLLAIALLFLTTSCSVIDEMLQAEPPQPEYHDQHFTHPQFDTFEIRSLAVVFDNSSNLDLDTAQIQAEIEGSLLSKKHYRIVTRTRLQKLLDEQSLAVSDITEDPGVLGGLLNVDALLFVTAQSLSLDQGWQGTTTATLLSVATGETCFTGVLDFRYVVAEYNRAVSLTSSKAMQYLPEAPP